MLAIAGLTHERTQAGNLNPAASQSEWTLSVTPISAKEHCFHVNELIHGLQTRKPLAHIGLNIHNMMCMPYTTSQLITQPI